MATVAIPAAVLFGTPTSASKATPKPRHAAQVFSSTTLSTTTSLPALAPMASPAPDIESDITPPSTPAPAAVAVSGCFADLAVQVGWPADAIGHLTAIIERESHCDPNASTGYRPSTGDWSLGLLQINTLGELLPAVESICGISAREQLLDPATNLRCGLALYSQRGFQPWGG